MKSNAEITDYNDAFTDWYIGGKTDDALYEILVQYKTRERQVELLKEMLKQAYTLGLNTAAQDSLDTLRQYATACAGLPARVITAEEMYDTAAQNLMVYFTKTLDNFERNK
jgi:hypothetical protein